MRDADLNECKTNVYCIIYKGSQSPSKHIFDIHIHFNFFKNQNSHKGIKCNLMSSYILI